MSDSLRIADGGAAAATTARRAWARLVGRVAAISDDETRVSVRGFKVDRPEVVERLETIGQHFVAGYSAALQVSRLSELVPTLARHGGEFSGFVHEGAAMGLAVADWMTPRRRLFDDYVAGPANAHEYMAWIGLGWALARLPVAPLHVLARRRGLNRWLALDGWGFHEGYFHWPQSVARQRRPRALAGDAARVFDQGLGRSLWFVCGADAAAVAAAITLFDEGRRADLWSGAGLAVAYAGGATAPDLRSLPELAGVFASALAQGAVFAAQARRRAANPTPHTEAACGEMLGLAAGAAADIALECLPAADDLQAYQRWRLDIQQRCAARLRPGTSGDPSPHGAAP